MGCKTERECLKNKRIGQSAAKFPMLDNTKLMCYNKYGKKFNDYWLKYREGKCPKWEPPKVFNYGE